MLNRLDRAIGSVFPGWALSRARARARLEVLARSGQYEGAKPGPERRGARYSGSANRATDSGAVAVREQARHLERNHDLVRGGLSSLVRNTIGANGIQVEPLPRDRQGRIHDEVAEALRLAHVTWSERPEVTWTHDRPAMERKLARSFYRDGEAFVQRLRGNSPRLDHGTAIPYSAEMLEADMCPLDYNVDADGIRQGIELNAWGRARAFHLYRVHPGEFGRSIPSAADLKRVSASRMLHVAARDRIGQVRGVSLFASVLARFEHLLDYEESEAVAAKVAASMAAAVVKGGPDQYVPETEDKGRREMTFVPGMIFDDLLPGETIETIDAKRPNPTVEAFRGGQLRAAAAGIEVSGSDLSKDYSNGTFSSLRQELIAQWAAYAVLAADFVNAITRPMYRDVVDMAVLVGLVPLPDDLDISTLYHALYTPVPMPWIDPQKEAAAHVLMKDNMLESAINIIRGRGRVPRDVIEQHARWQRMLADAGVAPTATAAPAGTVSGSDFETDEETTNVATA